VCASEIVQKHCLTRLVFPFNNHPEGSAETLPRFQLEQIKTSVQKTEHATQKPKRGKKLLIKQKFEVISSRL